MQTKNILMEKSKARYMMKRRVISFIMILPLLSLGALAVNQPTVSDWLSVKFMFDKLGIEKYELKMETAISYIEDNELGETDELSEILSDFRDAAADLEAYTPSKDPNEQTYNETKDNLFEIVSGFGGVS